MTDYKPVNMDLVNSKNIFSVGYGAETSELHVRFRKSGLVYVYSGVPWAIFEGLATAAKKTAYLNENIKGVFEFRKLNPQED